MARTALVRIGVAALVAAPVLAAQPASADTSTLAYLDPGTGSMILQGLLAGAAGVVVLFKLFGRRILRLFGIGRRGEQSELMQPTSEPVDDAVPSTEASAASVSSASHEGARQA